MLNLDRQISVKEIFFVYRYAILAAEAKKSSTDVVESSKAMIKAIYERGWLEGDQCQPGVTKVMQNIFELKIP